LFSNEPLRVTLGVTAKNLWDFYDFSQNLGMFPSTANVAKFAQICQKLPKDNKFEKP
jgi:hypothetical protein